jgi:membrane protease YdiL (CAAX protease family)
VIQAPFVAGRVGIAGACYLLFMGVYLPWMAWRTRAKLAGGPILPPRARYFTSVIVTQVWLLIVGLAVAWACRVRLYRPIAPRPLDLALGAACLAAMVAFMVPRWKAAVRKGDRRLYFFMPTGANEKALWTGVSLIAGFGEESIYRGVIFALLVTLTNNVWIAALGSALVFAAGHAFQSRRSMMIIFVFSLVFQALTLVTGALYVAMAVHFLYDVVAGFTYSHLGRIAGYRADGAPDAIADAAGTPAA